MIPMFDRETSLICKIDYYGIQGIIIYSRRIANNILIFFLQEQDIGKNNHIHNTD
jgi:hypothetical protein